MPARAYALFLRAAALGDGVDLPHALDAWGAFCDAAEAEIEDPGQFTDVAGLATMAASGRLRRGDYFELLGRAGSAATERAAAAALVATHGEDAAKIEVRRTLANSLKYQARYGEALAEFAAIEAAFNPASQPIEYARIALDQAMLFEWLGDFDRADRALGTAHDAVSAQLVDAPAAEGRMSTMLSALADPVGTERRVALQQLRMELGSMRGMIAKRTGRLDDAVAHYRSVRDDHVAWGVGTAIDYHLMHLDQLAGKGHLALMRLGGLDALMRSDDRFHGKIPALHWVAAEASLDQDHDPTWALDRVLGGIPMLERTGDLEVLWKLHHTAAKALILLDRPVDAEGHFLAAARVVDTLRRVPLGYRLESTYFADRRPLFADAIRYCSQTARAEAAFELLELAKSRSLATLVYGARQSLVDNPTGALVDDLSRQIDALDLQRFDGQQIDGSERNLLLEQRATAIEQIRATDPRWRSITERASVSPSAVAAALDGAVGISLFVDDDALIAVSIDAGGLAVARHEVAADTWHEINDYCDNIRRGEDPWAYDLSGYADIGVRDLLPAATCERLLAHDRAVISAHGVLHLLPWSALDIDGQRLFEHVGTSTVPNLMCLPALSGTWSKNPAVWVVGAPTHSDLAGLGAADDRGIEFDQLEAAWAGAPMGSFAGGTRGDNSIETSMRAALTGAIDLLHISCHGVIDHVEPSASALVMADGKVDAAEIALGGACPDEVVLAACSTGYRPAAVDGLALTGDDAVGMPAAFLEAGARSILMSIPQAHDATSVEYMTRYHTARADGMAPIDAYRTTQVAMLDVADPSLWCGYVLYGSPGR